ncbi:biotin--[acetyl-CoA-carboxylase] ligase [Hyphococcus sp.]|uniref:biotin--[acetyl-CoA-carboxylase] ligase n=1 Tax=Hyphococcus sp. TaxID=2038636 RepID=UPI00207EBF19|nr:MAG: biotin--[acetyl-CoA-carboxylase] ligase [Marinicaulis sp.]
MAKLASGTPLEIFDTLDSTSLEAKRWANDGGGGPRWFLALTQTAGYGRRERAWEQRAGDFAATLLMRAEETSETLGQISFVAALALASVFDELMPEDKIALKWPNDVLIEGGKGAGILLENLGATILIGIGVNIVSKPEGLAYKTARLIDHTPSAPPPTALAARLDEHFWRYYGQWRKEGFTPIRAAWLARAAGLNQPITVRLPNEEINGVFGGIDETGALILRLDARTRTIAAGEVFFGRKGKE